MVHGLECVKKIIKDSNINLNNNKNVTIIAAVLTLGVSGAVCNFGVVSIGTTALAMIVGIVLNLILQDGPSRGLRRKTKIIENCITDAELEELTK